MKHHHSSGVDSADSHRLAFARTSANKAAARLLTAPKTNAASELISRRALRRLRRAADCLTLLLPPRSLAYQPAPPKQALDPVKMAASANGCALKELSRFDKKVLNEKQLPIFIEAKQNLAKALKNISSIERGIINE